VKGQRHTVHGNRVRRGVRRGYDLNVRKVRGTCSTAEGATAVGKRSEDMQGELDTVFTSWCTRGKDGEWCTVREKVNLLKSSVGESRRRGAANDLH